MIEIDELSPDIDDFELVGRLRGVDPEQGVFFLADQTGIAQVRMGEEIERMEGVPLGTIVTVMSDEMEESDGEPIVYAKGIKLDSDVDLVDEYDIGILPFWVVSRMDWLEGEAELMEDEDEGGAWIREEIYQARPWWTKRKLFAVLRKDFIFDWEIEEHGVPQYVQDQLDDAEVVDEFDEER